jgi:hypothetical protein
MGKGAHVLPSRKVIAVVLFFSSGLFLLIGFSYLTDMIIFKLNATSTIGLLTRYLEKNSGDISYAPVYSYHDASGKEHEITSNSYANSPVGKIGDTVSVYYHNSNPADSRVMNDIAHALFPISLVFVSIIEFFIGILLVRSIKKNNNEKDRIYSIV